MKAEFLGTVDYASNLQRMQDYTATRGEHSPDLLLICEHESVYTLGQSGNLAHILEPANTPVVHSNRGGQVTYHGPGQVLAYPLLDLRRAGYFVKEYVYRLEESLIRTLMHFGVTGHRVRGAPGIYVRLADPFGHAKLPVFEQNCPSVSDLPLKMTKLGSASGRSTRARWCSGRRRRRGRTCCFTRSCAGGRRGC